MLNEIRIGHMSHDTIDFFRALERQPAYPKDGILPTELFPLRGDVDASNKRRLDMLKGTTYEYRAVDDGLSSQLGKQSKQWIAPELLQLKVNAQVMLIKNMDDTHVNGSKGIVVGFSSDTNANITSSSNDDDDRDLMDVDRKPGQRQQQQQRQQRPALYPVVQFVDGSTMLVREQEWKIETPEGVVIARRTQIPLILCWALSIHKSQGQTLQRVVVDLKKSFEKGQVYVALSRATSPDCLQVKNFNPLNVMVHDRVAEFYASLKTL